MEETKENIKLADKQFDGNFFGWKWSLFSLFIIIIGVIALAVVKPDSLNKLEEYQNIDADSVHLKLDSLNKNEN